MATEEKGDNHRCANFSAGPAVLPLSVLQEVQNELINYNGLGLSVLEMSHRSKAFVEICTNARDRLRSILNIPDNYAIFFTQGGATTSFASIAYNLLGGDENSVADYVITGNWSKKGYDEVQKIYPGRANVVYNNFVDENGEKITDGTKQCTVVGDFQMTPNAKYVHLCINETVHGVTMRNFPDHPCIVADWSSAFLSEPLDVSKFGVIYGGAQKNIGPAGVTVMIVRNDLLGQQDPRCPTLLNWAILNGDPRFLGKEPNETEYKKKNSMYNTPPCFAIYVMGKVFKWVDESIGGLEAMKRRNEEKAGLVYGAAQSLPNFYVIPVLEPFRSRMNIRLNIRKTGLSAEENGALEAKFVKEAEGQGLMSLKGYRTLGGIRASCYNAQPIENCQKLANFMQEFARANGAE